MNERTATPIHKGTLAIFLITNMNNITPHATSVKYENALKKILTFDII